MGDSERRQLDEARAWCDRKGYTLDECDTLVDRGLSGYKGHHRTRGKLGRFLQQVEDGRVPPGSVLLVENIDRLGREGPSDTLQQIIFGLWKHGVTVQTIRPEEAYEPGCDRNPKFVVLILYLQRAWDESECKSERVRAARDSQRRRAREGKDILTRRCPAWLRVTEDDRFEAIPEAVATLRTIFELRRSGIGAKAITRKLNEGRHWHPHVSARWAENKRKGPEPGWRESYVKKLLTNRALIGEYQPCVHQGRKRIPTGDPIAGYYPVVVQRGLFQAVGEQMAENGKAKGHRGGQTGRAHNLFPHLAKCAYCGGPMTFVSYQYGERPRGRRYLVCERGRRRLTNPETGQPWCAYRSIRYEEVERLILDHCRDLRPEQVLPNPEEAGRLAQSLRARLQATEAEIREAERKLDNLADLMIETDDKEMRTRLQSREAPLKDRRAVLHQERDAIEKQLQVTEQGLESVLAWKKNLWTLKEALATGEVEIRLKLRAHLRELIDRIEVFTDGITEESDDFVFPPPEAYPKEFRPFLRFVEVQRRTKEGGRFVRIHFKTETTMATSPLESFADGVCLVKGFDGAWGFPSARDRERFEAFQAKRGNQRRRPR